ncbi:MAG: YdaU family protein [Alcaligenaceae bacterium]|jgi:uncharacterized protein YdaU (DUF1376 family)|nr:YdaU family protein [Alcaligenaceae bacterium]
MNYYPHHIGDFNSATRHLTRIERSVYRDLIDLYYDTEAELTLDFNGLCRLIIARSDEERTAVEQVLNEFFTKTEHGWFHARCDEEIQKYRTNIEAKSAAGKASAARRAQKTTRKGSGSTASAEHQNYDESTSVEQVLNKRSTDEQLTKNQEPRTNYSDTDVSGAQAPVEPVEVIFGRGVPLLTASGVSEKNARSMLGMLRKTHGDENVIAALQACVDSNAMEPVAYLQGVLRAAKAAPKPRTSRADERASWMASFWQPVSQPMKDMGVIDAAR